MTYDQKNVNTKVSRRKHLSQIFLHQNLSDEQKVFGAAIWRRVNRKDGFTRANVSTLARDIGIKWASAQNDLEHLVAIGLFKVERRGDSDVTRPVPIFDGHSPIMAYGKREFERGIRIWLDHVITDLSLTITQRVVAYGYLALTDSVLATCNASAIDVANLIGVHPNTARTAHKALIDRGWLSVKDRLRYGLLLNLRFATETARNEYKKVQSNQQNGQASANPLHQDARNHKQPTNETNNETTNEGNKLDKDSPVISEPISENSEANLSYPCYPFEPRKATPYAATAAQSRQTVFLPIAAGKLIELIEEYASAENLDAYEDAIRISGLIAFSKLHELTNLNFGDDIFPRIRSGLLVRMDRYGRRDDSGDFLMISQVGVKSPELRRAA